MKYESYRFIKEEKEIDISFPFYMARHRRYTYAKFELAYYLHDPTKIECVYVTIAEHGFSINPRLEKKRFHVSNNILSRDFKNFYDEYEHTVSQQEYENHVQLTLKELAFNQ